LIFLSAVGELEKTYQRVFGARAMLETIAQLDAAIRDAETKQRTFLVTGANNDLWDYQTATNAIAKPLEALAEQARSNEVQQVRVASLRPQIARKRQELERVAKLRSDGGYNPAQGEVGRKQSPPVQEEYQSLLDDLKKGEDHRFALALVSGRRAIGRSLGIFALTSGLSLVSLGLLARGSRRVLAERQRTEGELRQQEEWLSATLASLGDAVIATDERGRVRLINPAAQVLTGWGAQEAKGQALDAVFPLIREESREPVESPVKKMLSEGVSVGLVNHTLLIARDGSERPIEHCGAPIRGNDGGINGVVLCFRDVTDRHWAELELKRAKESSDAANRAKDQFLAVLSHELRTPLTPVMVAITAMIEGGSPNELLPDLEMIRRNIELESRLIDDLLDLSRIARGGLRLQMEIVDVHEAIRRALEMCRVALQQAGLVVHQDLSALNHHARGDEMRLMQVFWNLTTNATKFTPTGGSLEVRTRNENRSDGDRLVVEFRDTGIGLDPDLLPRIFDPFEQGDRVFRTRYGGLGLGLAISKNVVEAHGGDMSAKSPGPGRGSTFRVDLPVVPAPARPIARPLAPPSPQNHRRLSILLVEDNRDTLRYLTLVLGQQGHRVLTASSLSAARETASAEEIDLLISDVELPDGSGLELMRELSAERGVKGIAISGFGADEDLQLSEDAGFHAHLLKPIDVRKLDEAIRTVFSRSEFSRP
jgi:PAS domain S-box-containing protein